VRWLQAHTDLEIQVVLCGAGPLIDEYRSVADTRFADGSRRGRRRLRALADGADVVYANTVVSLSVWTALTGRPPAVVHLHEMRYALEVLTHEPSQRAGLETGRYLDGLLAGVATVIVPSERNREDLAALAPRAAAKTHVIPEMIDVDSVATAAAAPESHSAPGIPHGVPLVVGCGTPEWRKGTDLFIQVAATVIRSCRHEVHFAWLGFPAGSAGDGTRAEFDFDVAAAGLSGRVHAVTATENPAALVQAADVFLLPSREDPFPLVVLEAAALGKPTVCFDNVGIAGFVAADSGLTVRYLDTTAMAGAVQHLIEDVSERQRLGAGALGNVRDYDIAAVAPRLHGLIVAAAG
jgi:glycosyltransferase involved in cell wall biosynthesis